MGIVIALVLAAIGVFATWYYGTTGPPAKTDVAEAATTGYLVPAHDPTPPLPNGATAPTNLVTLFLGNSASVGVWFPHTVLAYKGKPVLTISTNSEGATVSAEFFGDNGDIVAVLKDGQFVINRLNYFVKERPDKSSLIVRDQKNITVLNVRILNPHAIPQRTWWITHSDKRPNNGVTLAYKESSGVKEPQNSSFEGFSAGAWSLPPMHAKSSLCTGKAGELAPLQVPPFCHRKTPPRPRLAPTQAQHEPLKATPPVLSPER
jgi:hypothetical protein